LLTLTLQKTARHQEAMHVAASAGPSSGA
jgi:hypothetical protein